MNLKDKYTKLINILKEMDSAVIAFSGGVDSSLLLAAAKEALGDKVIAVAALSATYPKKEFETAKQIAKQLNAKLETIDSNEMSDPNFSSNPTNRCYYCKKHLFCSLKEFAKNKGYKFVVEGSNFDDTNDYRPGLKATRELEISSPLMEAELTKDEIRQLLKEKNIPVWNKPSQACLSSRIAYNEDITIDKLTKIEKAEEEIRNLGFKIVRVRCIGKSAKIEVGKDELKNIMKNNLKSLITNKLLNLGFDEVIIDPKGYRTGSMNEQLVDG